MSRLVTPRLALLASAHLTIDAYSSFFTPLLPLLVAKLDLTLGRVGALVALMSVASSLSQPLFGLLADRVRRPWFVAFGPVLAACFMSAIGVAADFGTLAWLLVLGGIGIAAFHPQAAALAGEEGGRRAFAFSIFSTGGTLGFSIGPLIAVSVVGLVGLERTWVAAIPGLVVCGLLLRWFSRVPPRPAATGARPRLSELRPLARPLALLYFLVVFRSAVAYGFMTFLPIYLTRRGFSVGAAGAVLAAYLAAGAAGALAGAWMADRLGGRRVIVNSLIGGIPLFFAFLLLPPGPGLACLVAGNLVLQGSLPVNVAMGQELSPAHASTISSLLMGFAWGIGVMLVGPIGALADARGLPVALFTLAFLLPAGLVCAIALPRAPRPAPAPAAIAGRAPAE